MSQIQKQFEFGTGSFIGDYLHHEVDSMPIREQALAAGWADGCPVAVELTDPENTTPGRGPENMLGRYGEVNFWFGQLVREIEPVNQWLSTILLTNEPRRPGEPVGKHEPESVPEGYASELSPMNTLTGYALPRIFVEQLHAKGDDRESQQNQMFTGIELVLSAASEVDDPLDLLAVVSNKLSTEAQLPDEKIFKHILSNGWLGEHNAHDEVDDFLESLSKHAPGLYERYTSMSQEERVKSGLIS